MGKWYALGGVILILVLFVLLYFSLLNKWKLYDWIIKVYPGAELYVGEMKNSTINRRQFLYTVLISVLIEFIGIAHVYISMHALNLTPSLSRR